MRVLRALGIVAVAVALLLAPASLVFWWGWLRVPSPAAVCDHVLAIAPAGSHDAAALRRECLRNAQPPEYGRLSYTQTVKCVMAARSASELAACRAGL